MFCYPSRREPSPAFSGAERGSSGSGAFGFVVHHVTRSHYILQHETQTELRVPLPWHGRDPKHGTLSPIIDQTGLTRGEVIALLFGPFLNSYFGGSPTGINAIGTDKRPVRPERSSDTRTYNVAACFGIVRVVG